MRNSFPEDVVVVKGIKRLEKKVINIHNSPPVPLYTAFSSGPGPTRRI